MNILALDTSSACGSAALMKDGAPAASTRISQTLDHARNLVPAVTALLSQNGLELADIDLAVFGKGPGSFIGSRIAMVAVQALSGSFGTPLMPVSSLLAYDFPALPFEADGERHFYVCKSKSGTYNFIVRERGAAAPATEGDEREASEDGFIAMLRPGDVVAGPLTPKNMESLATLAKVRTVSLYPDAAMLIQNNLQVIEGLLARPRKGL